MLTAKVPAVNGDRVRLELRCPGWIPAKVVSGSQDPRTLGVRVFTVTLAGGGGKRPSLQRQHGTMAGGK